MIRVDTSSSRASSDFKPPSSPIAPRPRDLPAQAGVSLESSVLPALGAAAAMAAGASQSNMRRRAASSHEHSAAKHHDDYHDAPRPSWLIQD